MYGIMTSDGCRVLCHSILDSNMYVLKRWDRNGIPVMRKCPLEIDQLLQDYVVAANFYDVAVFEFTKEQEENILVRRLKGI